MTYTAAGEKITKFTAANTGIETTQNYVSGIEYNGTLLEAVYHEEGRLVPNGTAWHYEYTLKDHLGNSRVMFRANGSTAQLLQENHYYPFGMEMEGAWTAQVGTENKYQYNGKELVEDFGWNWYPYGARYYDAAVGRFWGVDPIADRFAHASVYNYAENEPVANIDLHGLQKERTIGKEEHDNQKRDQEAKTDPENPKVRILQEGTRVVTATVGDALEELNAEEMVEIPQNGYTPIFDHSDGVIPDPTGGVIADVVTAVETVEQIASGWGLLKAAAARRSLKNFDFSSLRIGGKAGGQGFKSFSAFKRAMGSAGPGQAWHHIVGQTPGNVVKFGNQTIHNTGNLIKLPHGAGSIHARVSGYYSSIQPFTNGQTVRQWLSAQNYQTQYDFGIQTLKNFGWTP